MSLLRPVKHKCKQAAKTSNDAQNQGEKDKKQNIVTCKQTRAQSHCVPKDHALCNTRNYLSVRTLISAAMPITAPHLKIQHSGKHNPLPLQQPTKQAVQFAHHALNTLPLGSIQALHRRMLGLGIRNVSFAAVNDGQHVLDVVGVEPGA